MVRSLIRMLAVAVPLLGGPSAATGAAEVTLRFAHFWPAVPGSTHERLFQAWADAVEARSGGRIEVQMFPSSTLVKPLAQYQAVKDGIADLTATVQGYSANRFPLTQVVELPGLVDSAAQGSCILQSLYDEGLIAGEYEDTKPLFFFTHGPGRLHTRGTLVRAPEDLAGLRIRRPTAVVARLLKSLGAQPVGMPAPDSYQAMQRGVIDGVTLPWEAALEFRLNELADSHTEVGGLYTLAFVVTMNRTLYEGLPDDLRRVIDAHTGMDWAMRAAEVYDDLDVAGRAEAVAAGHDIFTVEGGVDHPAWKAILDPVPEAYVSDLEAHGLPARAVYGRARELAAICR